MRRLPGRCQHLDPCRCSENRDEAIASMRFVPPKFPDPAMSRARSAVTRDNSGRPSLYGVAAPGALPVLPGVSVALVKTTILFKKEQYFINADSCEDDDTDCGVIYSKPIPGPTDNRGLVICCHGKLGNEAPGEQYFDVFETLARCLVANGFVVASIRHRKTGRDNAAKQFLTHTSFLLGESESTKNPAVKFSLFGKPLTLLGQSEGAHGAILAALAISNFAISNVIGFVSAVVCLAPTTTAQIKGPYATDVLMLEGSHDGDEPWGAGSLLPYEFCQPSNGTKHFIWVHGANHIKWMDADSTADPIHPLGPDELTALHPATQKLIMQNYVAGFLRWKLLKEVSFRPPFVGDGTFAWATSPDFSPG